MKRNNKKSKHLKFWEEFLTTERSTLKRYSFALLVSSLSLFLVIVFQDIEEGAAFTSFAVLSVILSAIYGGKGPAFVDTFLTSIGIDYFFSKPYLQVFDSFSSIIRVITYVAVGYLIANLVESLKDSLLISREQKLEVELEKKARENVLGVVSHDLRTPLSSVILNADLLLRGIDSGKVSASAPRLVSKIKNSAYRMNRLIEDLLDAVKVEAGQFKIEKAENEITEIVNASIEESLATANVKDIKIKTQLPTGLNFVNCDQSRLIQVMNNLLGNAIKFSPHESEIFVRVIEELDEVTIQVKDQGPGISREDLVHLFERYWQAETTAHNGTGLGLFISKSIVELHDGTIEVSSNLGEGATFSLRLPKVHPEILDGGTPSLH